MVSRADPLRLRVLDSDYNDMLAEHFARIVDELERKRRRWRSPSELRGFQLEIRKLLKDALGGLPEKRDELNAKVLGKLERRDYIIEKVVFESRPKLYVTGNLYIPKHADFPAPAILRVHGHWRHAKSQDVVQATCAGLASKGYVVLAIDAIGYGERRAQGDHSEGVWLPAVGLTLQGLIIWDNMRALDYLQSREEVDPERIGVTGASGGGNQTMYLAALDERVKAAVPVVSAEVFEDQVASGRCYCECIPGILKFANIPDILSLIAPRPLLLINGVKDRGFTILRARKAFSRVKAAYEALGAEEKVALFEVYAGHDYNREMREAMYLWFDRWLKGEDKTESEEPILELEPDLSYSLNCFHTFPRDTQTISGLYYEEARKLKEHRLSRSVDEWLERRDMLRREIIDEVLGGFPEREAISARTLEIMHVDGLYVEKVVLRSESDIIIPMIIAKKEEDEGTSPVVLCVSPLGKGSMLARKHVREFINKGYMVASIDYRGIGETRFSEVIAAKNSIVIGRHILGMRVYDVVRTLDYLTSRPDISKSDISCWAEDEAGLVALFAAALDERIKGLTLERTLASWESPSGFSYSPSIFPPNILKYADIPELAALVAPRRVTLVDPLDPQRQRLTLDEALKVFDFTIKVYEELNASDNLKIITSV